ncbi:MAG TPA: crosslink repair DNA glycosylase YcaQ family protein [Actinomycetota bacterium]|jgi:uncharacterized protein YcaQ|nr:crosslink repair DNA glycosylase YcaQ family protein [Actinomycetota bacterium]
MEISAVEARRIALEAQGFGVARPVQPGLGHVRRLAERLNAFQIDSVNVLVRAHYMPAFSRLGPYPQTSIDTLAYAKRDFFEFWGHAACYMPMSLYPYFRWRMDAQRGADYFVKAPAKAKRYIEDVYADVAERGPLSASEVKDAGKSTGNWWGWSDGKRAIETLFRMGRVAIAGRRGFERLYDIRDRVIPAAVLGAPVPSPDDAKKHLLVRAAAARGVGTARGISDYFYVDGWWDRQHVNGKRRRTEIPRLISELVEDGRFVPASVEGWREKAYVVPGVKKPKSMHARAIVSPFDPLMWERRWTFEVFGFHYQIEIYVPAPKRVYGYYVLPFLLGDRYVARVDLKADRKRCVLMVPGAFAEPDVRPQEVAGDLGAELRVMADWLGLERIEVGSKGDLAGPLGRAVK